MSNFLLQAPSATALVTEKTPVAGPASVRDLTTTSSTTITTASSLPETVQSAQAPVAPAHDRVRPSQIQKSSTMLRPWTPQQVELPRGPVLHVRRMSQYPNHTQHPQRPSVPAPVATGMNFPADGSMPAMVDQQFSPQPFQPGYYGDLQYAAEMQAAGGMQVPIIQSESEIAKQKRKEQNRIAQKNFRSRNNTKIKDLECQLNQVSSELKQTKDENASLASKMEHLENELRKLREDNYRMRASQEPSPVPSEEHWGGWTGSPGL